MAASSDLVSSQRDNARGYQPDLVATVTHDLVCPSCLESGNPSIAVLCKNCSQERLTPPSTAVSRLILDVRVLRLLPLLVVSISIRLGQHWPLYIACGFFLVLLYSSFLRRHYGQLHRFLRYMLFALGITAIIYYGRWSSAMESMSIAGEQTIQKTLDSEIVSSFLPGLITYDTNGAIIALILAFFLLFVLSYALNYGRGLASLLLVGATVLFFGFVSISLWSRIQGSNTIASMMSRLALWTGTSALGTLAVTAIVSESKRQRRYSQLRFPTELLDRWTDMRLSLEIEDRELPQITGGSYIDRLVVEFVRLAIVATNSVVRELTRFINAMLRTLDILVESLLRALRFTLDSIFGLIQRLVYIMVEVFRLITETGSLVMKAVMKFISLVALPMTLAMIASRFLWFLSSDLYIYFHGGGVALFARIIGAVAIILTASIIIIRLLLRNISTRIYLSTVIRTVVHYGAKALFLYWLYALSFAFLGHLFGIGPFRFGPAFVAASAILGVTALMALSRFRSTKPSN